jgi:hypothetical protein
MEFTTGLKAIGELSMVSLKLEGDSLSGGSV